MSNIKKLKQLFFHSIKRGTGEAFLILKDNPTIDFSRYIIKGALKNYEYDGQAENSRAQYIFDLFSISLNQEKIRNSILFGLETHVEDTWTLTQLFDLAKLFAQQGDDEARQAIYNRFYSNIIDGSDWVGYQEILDLDGIKGLIFIADKIGKALILQPDDWHDNSIIRSFQDDNPEINAIEILENEAKLNNHIQIYLNNISKTELSYSNHEKNKFDFQTLNKRIEEGKKFFIHKQYTKNLTNEEIIKLANSFLNETNLVKKELYLNVFSRIKYPYDHKILLKLARRKPTNKNQIMESAIYALEHFKSNEIREFAFQKLNKTRSPGLFLDLLINNYKKGDSDFLKSLAEKFINEDIIENLIHSYTDIYEVNKTEECLEPLLVLYRKSNCGIHRQAIIEILLKNDVLPDFINNEIQHDSKIETRKLYKMKG